MAKHDFNSNGQGSQVVYITNKSKERRSRLIIILIALLLLIGGFAMFAIIFNTSKPVVASELNSPTGVVVTTQRTDSGNRYILSFDEVEHADGYAVYIFKGMEDVQRAKENAYENVVPKFSFRSTTRDITNYLSGSGIYYVSVQALYFKVPSYNSVLSDPEQCPVDVYYDIKTPVVSVNNDSLSFSWTVDESAELGTLYHELKVLDRDNNNNVVLTITTQSNSYTLTQEQANLLNSLDSLNFAVSVQTFSTNSYLLPSSIAYGYFNTYKQIASPNLTLSQQGRRIVLSWDNVKFAKTFQVFRNGLMQKVFVSEDDAGSYEISSSSSTVTVFFTDNDDVGTYSVYVEAKNPSDNIFASTSNVVSYTIKKQTNAVDFKVFRSGEQGDRIDVSWRAEEQTRYKVFIQDKLGNYFTIPGSSNQWYAEIDGGTVSFPVDLSADGYYLVSVVAKKQSDYYTESDISSKFFKFETLKHEAPIEVTYNSATQVLSWTPFANSYATDTLEGSTRYPALTDIDGYEITIYYQNENNVVKTFRKQRNHNESVFSNNNLNLSEFLAENSENPGTYFASVKTLGGYLIFTDSDESEKCEFYYSVLVATPQNLQFVDTDQDISQHKLEFSVVSHAKGYQLFVDGVDGNVFVDTTDETNCVVKTKNNLNEWEVNANFNATITNGVLSLSGFDYYFNEMQGQFEQGSYNFAVKAIALDDSNFGDSELSQSVSYSFVRYLPVPDVFIASQAENSNNLYVVWDRLDSNMETIYDEYNQHFDINVNGYIISIDNQSKLAACGTGDDTQYRLNISDYVIPKATNTVQITALGYTGFTTSASPQLTNVAYHYYIGAGYDETRFLVEARAIKKYTDVDDELNFYLMFYSDRYANKFNYTFVYTDSESTVHSNSASYDFYANGQTTAVYVQKLNPTWLAEYTKTRIICNPVYDENNALPNTTVDKNYIHSQEFSKDFYDNSRMPQVYGFSYDSTTSTFYWRFLKTASAYVTSFKCNYRYIVNGVYENVQEMTLSKSNETEDGDYMLYSEQVFFEKAGTIEFSMWPYSSFDSVQNRTSNKLTQEINVNVKLEAPQNLKITQNLETQQIFVSWDIVRKQNRTGDAYCVQLFKYEDENDETGVFLGELTVGQASARITVNAKDIYENIFSERFKIRAKVFACGYNVDGGAYLQSETTTSELFEYLPILDAPVVTLNGTQLQIKKIQPESFVTLYSVYYYNDDTQTQDDAQILGEFSMSSGATEESLIGFEHTEYLLNAKLADYLNNNLVANGLYKIFVVATNENWKNIDGSVIKSEPSLSVAVEVSKKFDTPEIYVAEGFTGEQTSATLIPTFETSFKNIKGTSFGEEQEILPGGYSIKIQTSGVAQSDVLTLGLQISLVEPEGEDAYYSYSLNYNNAEFDFADINGTLTAMNGDNVLATLVVGDKRIGLKFYGATGFLANTQYQLVVIAKGKVEKHFNESNPYRVTFRTKSAVITAPEIGFYDGSSVLKDYATSNDQSTRPLAVYIQRTPNSYYDSGRSAAWINFEITQVYGSGFMSVESQEPQTVLLTDFSYEGKTYYKYLIDPVSLFLNKEGIYKLIIKFGGNQYANESSFSNPIYIFYSKTLDSVYGFSVESAQINSTDPVSVKISVLNEFLTDDFKGFDLEIKTVDIVGNHEQQTTNKSLFVADGSTYLAQKQQGEFATLFTYEIPIEHIAGFKLEGKAFAYWTTFDYNFEFGVRVMDFEAKQKADYEDLLDCNDMPEEFVFLTHSWFDYKTIVTSTRTPSPAGLQITPLLGHGANVSWGEVSNATYGYAYYVWDLTTNTYELRCQDNTGRETLTNVSDKLYIDTNLLFANESYDDYLGLSDFWILTENNYFVIDDFDVNDSTKIYGVIVFSKSNVATIGYSTIVYQIFHVGSQDFQNFDLDISFDDVSDGYYLSWDDPFSKISTQLLPNNYKKHEHYVVSVIQEGIESTPYSTANNSVFATTDGKTSLFLSEIDRRYRNGMATMSVSNFAVVDELGTTHQIYNDKTLQAEVFLPIVINSNVWLEIDCPDEVTYILKWKATQDSSENYYATLYNFYLAQSSVTNLDVNRATGEASNAEDKIEVRVPTLLDANQTSVLRSDKLNEFVDPLLVDILIENEQIYYVCDISSWIESLQNSANPPSKGLYYLWASVATDKQENLNSSYTMTGSMADNETRAELRIFDKAGHVSNLNYNYTYNSNDGSRTKTLTFDMADDDLTRSILKVEVKKDIVENNVLIREEAQVLATETVGGDERPVYAAYFAYSSVISDARYSIIYFDGTTSFYVIDEQDSSVAHVQLNVFDYFENVDSGDFKVYVTVLPAIANEFMRTGDSVGTEFVNNRKIELSNALRYIDVVVDSYILAVNSDETSESFGEPIYDQSYIAILNEHLLSGYFNAKAVTRGLSEAEEPDEIMGYEVYFYKQGSLVKKLTLTGNKSNTTNELTPGVYTLKIVAKGDGVYYANSDLFDYDFGGAQSTITIYNRHMTTIDEDRPATEIRTTDGFDTLTDLLIEHGISEIGVIYEIYCIDENGDVVWKERAETQDDGNGNVVANVSVYQMMLKHIADMNYGNYTFKTKWLSTLADLSEFVLNSDLNETHAITYKHYIKTIHSTVLQKTDDINDGYIYETRDKLGYTWFDYDGNGVDDDISGYVTGTKLYTILLDPILDTMLHYQISFKSVDALKDSTNTFDAYVKVSYVDPDNDDIFEILYELVDVDAARKTSKIDVSGHIHSLFSIMPKVDPKTNISYMVLEFNALNYIYTTDEIVDTYNFNTTFVDVLRGEEPESIVMQANENFEEKPFFDEFAESSLGNSYVYFDVYATQLDLVDVDESNFEYWDILDMVGNLYINSVVLNTNRQSPSYGELSWSFTDNTRMKGNKSDSYYFIIYVNKQRIERSISVVDVESATTHNLSISLRSILLADNSTSSNANTIEMFLRVSDARFVNKSGWIDTPLITDIQTTSGINVASNEFVWETELDCVVSEDDHPGMNWDTTSGKVDFNYKFNKYYAQDTRLWNNGINSTSKVTFKFELIRVDVADYDENKTFEQLKELDIDPSNYGVFGQTELVAWCNQSSGGYNMTFNMSYLDQDTQKLLYSFNMREFLESRDNVEKDKWFDSEELKTGWYYIAISLVTQINPVLYEDSIVYSAKKLILAPWKITEIMLVDSIADSSGYYSSLFPTSENTKMIYESDSQETKDALKEAWAENENERNVFIKFKVEDVNGQYPTSYILGHSQEFATANSKYGENQSFYPISVQPIDGYIYIDVSIMFRPIPDDLDEDKAILAGKFKDYYGKHYFRVYGAKSDAVADMSSERTAKTTTNAMLHYLKFENVTNISFDFKDLKNSKLKFDWYCSFFKNIEETYIPGEKEPYFSIVNTTKYSPEESGENHGPAMVSVVGTEASVVRNNNTYSMTINLKNLDPETWNGKLHITPSVLELIYNTLSFKVFANNFGDGYILDSDTNVEDLPLIPDGLDAPIVGISTYTSKSKEANTFGDEEHFMFVSEDDNFDTIKDNYYYNLYLSLKTEAFQKLTDATDVDYAAGTNRYYAVVKVSTMLANQNSVSKDIFFRIVIEQTPEEQTPYKVVAVKVFNKDPSADSSAELIENLLLRGHGSNTKPQILKRVTSNTYISGASNDSQVWSVEITNVAIPLNWMFSSNAGLNEVTYNVSRTCMVVGQVVGTVVLIPVEGGQDLMSSNGKGEASFVHRVRMATPKISEVVVESDKGTIDDSNSGFYVFNYVEENPNQSSEIVKDIKITLTVENISSPVNGATDIADMLKVYIVRDTTNTSLNLLNSADFNNSSLYFDDEAEPSIICLDIPLSDCQVDIHNFMKRASIVLDKTYFLNYETKAENLSTQKQESAIYNAIVDKFIPGYFTFTVGVYSTNEASQYIRHKTGTMGDAFCVDVVGRNPATTDYVQDIVLEQQQSGEVSTTLNALYSDRNGNKFNVIRNIWGFYQTPIAQDIFVSTDQEGNGVMLFNVTTTNNVPFVSNGNQGYVASYVAGAKKSHSSQTNPEQNKFKTILIKKQLSFVETRSVNIDREGSNGEQYNYVRKIELDFAGAIEDTTGELKKEINGKFTYLTTEDLMRVDNHVTNLTTYKNDTLSREYREQILVMDPYLYLYTAESAGDEFHTNNGVCYTNINGFGLHLDFEVKVFLENTIQSSGQLGETIALKNYGNTNRIDASISENTQNQETNHNFYNQIDNALKEKGLIDKNGVNISFQITVKPTAEASSLWTTSQSMLRNFKFYHRISTEEFTVEKMEAEKDGMWTEEETIVGGKASGLLKPARINMSFKYDKLANCNIDDVNYQFTIFDYKNQTQENPHIYMLNDSSVSSNTKTYNIIDIIERSNDHSGKKFLFKDVENNLDWATCTTWQFAIQPYYTITINNKDQKVFGHKDLSSEFDFVLKLSHLRDISAKYNFNQNVLLSYGFDQNKKLLNADRDIDVSKLAAVYENSANAITITDLAGNRKLAGFSIDSTTGKTFDSLGDNNLAQTLIEIYSGSLTEYPESTNSRVGYATVTGSFSGNDVVNLYNAILQNSPGGVYTAFYKLTGKTASNNKPRAFDSDWSVAATVEYRKIYINPKVGETGQGDISLVQENDKIIIQGLNNEGISATKTDVGNTNYRYNAFGNTVTKAITNVETKVAYNNNLGVKVALRQQTINDTAYKDNPVEGFAYQDSEIISGESTINLQRAQSAIYTINPSSLDALNVSKDDILRVISDSKSKYDTITGLSNFLALGEKDTATTNTYKALAGGLFDYTLISEANTEQGLRVNYGKFQIGRNVVVISVIPKNSDYEIGYFYETQFDVNCVDEFLPSLDTTDLQTEGEGEKINYIVPKDFIDYEPKSLGAGGVIAFFLDDKEEPITSVVYAYNPDNQGDDNYSVDAENDEDDTYFVYGSEAVEVKPEDNGLEIKGVSEGGLTKTYTITPYLYAFDYEYIAGVKIPITNPYNYADSEQQIVLDSNTTYWAEAQDVSGQAIRPSTEISSDDPSNPVVTRFLFFDKETGKTYIYLKANVDVTQNLLTKIEKLKFSLTSPFATDDEVGDKNNNAFFKTYGLQRTVICPDPGTISTTEPEQTEQIDFDNLKREDGEEKESRTITYECNSTLTQKYSITPGKQGSSPKTQRWMELDASMTVTPQQYILHGNPYRSTWNLSVDYDYEYSVFVETGPSHQGVKQGYYETITDYGSASTSVIHLATKGLVTNDKTGNGSMKTANPTMKSVLYTHNFSPVFQILQNNWAKTILKDYVEIDCMLCSEWIGQICQNGAAIVKGQVVCDECWGNGKISSVIDTVGCSGCGGHGGAWDDLWQGKVDGSGHIDCPLCKGSGKLLKDRNGNFATTQKQEISKEEKDELIEEWHKFFERYKLLGYKYSNYN